MDVVAYWDEDKMVHIWQIPFLTCILLKGHHFVVFIKMSMKWVIVIPINDTWALP